MGGQNDRLGEALAPCGAGYIAAAAGTGRVALGPGASFGTGPSTPAFTDPRGPGFARSVACDTQAGSLRLLVAGDAGLFWTVDGGWQSAFAQDLATLAVGSADAGSPIAVGTPSGAVYRLESQLQPQSPQPLVAANMVPFPPALAWHPSQPVLTVGQSGLNRVLLYSSPAPGTVSTPATINGPELGRALAWGNFTPHPGLELAISGKGRVALYTGEPNQMVHVLDLVSPDGGDSFGASLATQSASGAGDLSLLWVGEPRAGAVWSFLGDAGTRYESTATGDAFGQALCAWSPNAVSVGAPASNVNAGVVYTQKSPTMTLGFAALCSTAAPCFDRNCTAGTCVGGVFCQRGLVPRPPCAMNQECNLSGDCVDVLSDGGLGPPMDGGNVGPPMDGGNVGPPMDGGNGGPPMDGGNSGPPMDGGNSGPPMDGGNSGPPMDGGNSGPPMDGGNGGPPMDGGSGGATDAGLSTDAGTSRDSGVVLDGGVRPDGGEGADAGAPTDAGPRADAGVAPADGGADDAGGGPSADPAPVRFTAGGCAAAPLSPLLFLALALARRRG